MDSLKSALIIEYQRLDLEYECIRSLEYELKEKGRYWEVEGLTEAKQHVYQALLQIKQVWKFLSDESGEQIKMDI